MKYKGITRGDSKFRHFTFDDEDITTKGGVNYYKVYYDKSPVDGEGAEPEIGYIQVDKVITIGARKPKKPATPVQEQVVKPVTPVQPEPQPVVQEEKKKRTRKSTKTEQEVKVVTPVTETIPASVPTYEYKVIELFSDDISTLESQLNELGNEGWEMCGFDTNKNLLGKIHIISIFKKKK